MSTTMQAIVCPQPGQLHMEERARPNSRAGHVRVQTRSVGICGTDFHILHGKHPFLDYPRVMGHELSGIALENSSNGRIREGDLVVVNPYFSCGQCRACHAGKPNACAALSVMGVHDDGGMCEEFVVPENNLYPATGLDEVSASMVEFLAIGAHAVARARIRPGMKSLVVGGGPIGIGVALFARFEGSEVTVRDISQSRLDKAVALIPGIQTSLVQDRISDPDVSAFDTVFDATGNIHSMNAGIHFVAHGGVYVLVSVVKEKLVISDPEFHKREASVLGSRNALAEDFQAVMSRMRSGDIPVADINTHTTTLDDAVPDLLKWLDNRDSLIKASIRFSA